MGMPEGGGDLVETGGCTCDSTNHFVLDPNSLTCYCDGTGHFVYNSTSDSCLCDTVNYWFDDGKGGCICDVVNTPNHCNVCPVGYELGSDGHTCSPVCGDGLVVPPETCDDGN